MRESERSSSSVHEGPRFPRALPKEGRKEERKEGRDKRSMEESKSELIREPRHARGLHALLTHTTLHHVRLCGGPVSVHRGEIISSMSLPHYAWFAPGAR